MSSTYEKAEAASELQKNPTFVGVIGEIRQGAINTFVDPNATPEMITAAHDKIKAIETVLNALQARITEQAFKAKKEKQNHGYD